MNPPRKTSKVITQAVLLLCVAAFGSFLMSGMPSPGNAKSAAVSLQERTLKLKTFKDIPVAIREVRNLNSETWHKDLAIEIKNISDKPIYFMLAYLIFVDEKVANGEVGISLMYGNPKKNGNIAKLADPADMHLEPGETYVFTIPEIDRKGLKAKHEKFPERTKNFLLRFAIINFGDGTGFEAGRSLDLRGRSPATSPPKQNMRRERNHSTSTATAPQESCGRFGVLYFCLNLHSSCPTLSMSSILLECSGS